MAFSPKQQIAALLIGATALAGAGGYVLGNMGESHDNSADNAPAAKAVAADTTAAPNPYQALHDRAQNHGEMGALVIFNEAARHFDVFDNPQNYTPDQARTAMYGVMDTLMRETNNLAQTTLAQYAPSGDLSMVDAETANNLYTKTQEACADVTAGDSDGNPDPSGYFQEFDGQSFIPMLTKFVNDVNRCVINLEMLHQTTMYLDAGGQSQSVSAEFRQAASPVDQAWANIIKLHNDSFGASKVVNDEGSHQRLHRTKQQMQQGQ